MLEPTDVLLPAMLAGFVMAIAALVFWRGQVVWRQTGKVPWWGALPLGLFLAPYASDYFQFHWFWATSIWVMCGVTSGFFALWVLPKLFSKS